MQLPSGCLVLFFYIDIEILQENESNSPVSLSCPLHSLWTDLFAAIVFAVPSMSWGYLLRTSSIIILHVELYLFFYCMVIYHLELFYYRFWFSNYDDITYSHVVFFIAIFILWFCLWRFINYFIDFFDYL